MLSTKGSDRLVWTSNQVKYRSSSESKEIIYQVHPFDSFGNTLDMIYKGTDTTFVVDLSKYITLQKFIVLVKDPVFELNSYSNTVSLYPEIPAFISKLEGLNENREAKLKLTDIFENQKYLVQYRTKGTANWLNSSAIIKKEGNSGEFVISGLDNKNTYCFRVMQSDTANKKDAYSNEVCSTNLKTALLSSESVKLEWSKIDTTNLNYSLIYSTDESGNIADHGYSAPDTSAIGFIKCSKKYKFTINSIYQGRRYNEYITIISAPMTVDPQTLTVLPPPDAMGTVTVKERKNFLSIAVFGLSTLKFNIYRSVNGAEMVKIAETSSTQFIDNEVDIEKNNYCYAFSYTDNCGKESQLTEKTCAVKLSWKTIHRISWNPIIIQSKNSYRVEKVIYTFRAYRPDGFGFDVDNTTDTTYTLDRYSRNWDNIERFEVRTNVEGKITINNQTINLSFYSFSNIISTTDLEKTTYVFPNPSDKEVKIYSPRAPIRYVEVFDVSGKMVQSYQAGYPFLTDYSTLDFVIDISTFVKGKYILRIFDKDRSLLDTQTIVKW